MRFRASHLSLLVGGFFVLPFAAQAQTQQQQPPEQQPPTQGGGAASTETQAGAAAEETGEEEEIVVVGQKPRGSVIGDIPPEKTYDSRDVRATGASNINELLDALAPEIGSSRGRGAGAPVLLLNGQRISSFRELRDIPTEAIQRVEILPEEVALKYGYRADKRVVNFVLRQRFRSTTALASGNAATDGGYAAATGDVTQLQIQRNGRTTLNVHASGNGLLRESERDIDLSPTATVDDRQFRSLLPSATQLRGTATVNRQVFGNVSGTLNAELEHDEGHSLVGLDAILDPRDRNTNSNTAHLGTTLNWDKSRWHFNVSGNADYSRNLTLTDPHDPAFDRNRARSTNVGGDLTGTANGVLFKLPAGDATTTLTLGGNTQHLDSESRNLGVITPSSLGRTTGQAAINLDLPVSRRNKDFSALGNLTLNANAELDQISDFGTLTTIGAGANWSPIDRLNFIGSWTREEGAPTINQLGDPVLVTENTRIFDFTTGQTILVTATTGGNPDLLADRRNVFKIGGNWQPLKNTDLRLRADYVHSRIDRPISSITVTPEIEAAFPDRFVRGACTPTPPATTCVGPLISVDLRPVNFDSSRKDTLRVGLDFSKPLKSKRPSQSVIDQIRAQFGGARRGGTPGGAGGRPPGPPPEGTGGGEGRGFGGRGFGGGGFGRGGFGNRGRLQFSLTDTITFVDKVTIAPGLGLDYLHGDAAGSTGGTPRHQVQAQAGYFNNGLGARLSADYRSGTSVNTLTGDNLRFSPLTTFDLRLFANPGDIPEISLKHPWLRGTQLRLEINNLFNSRPRVRDAVGAVPPNFQPDLLDPLGRTIMISFRKAFLPSPAAFRRQFQREREQRATSGGGDE